MDNTFTNLTGDIRQSADQIIDLLGLQGYQVSYKAPTRSIQFRKGLREMSVPVALVEKKQWADIRLTFRAVFEPGPPVETFEALNEWSRGKNK